MVTDIWQSVFAVDTAEQAHYIYEQLRNIEYPPSTSNTHLRQVILCMICVSSDIGVTSIIYLPLEQENLSATYRL